MLCFTISFEFHLSHRCCVYRTDATQALDSWWSCLPSNERERERGWWAIICLWRHKTQPAALGWRGQSHSVEYSWLNIRTVLIKNMEKCKINQRFARYSSITFTEQPFVRNYTFVPTYNLFQSPGHTLFFSQVSRVRWCLLTQTWPHKLACQRLLGHITTEV